MGIWNEKSGWVAAEFWFCRYLWFCGWIPTHSRSKQNAGESSALWPCHCFLEELSFIIRAIPAYYVAGLGKMLKNIISPEGQFPARVSFFPSPASKFKDPGPMTEELAHWWGVCISAQESDRPWGVSSVPQSFSSDLQKGPGPSWGLGRSSCRARVSMWWLRSQLHRFKSKAWTSPQGWDKGEAWSSLCMQKSILAKVEGRLAISVELEKQASNMFYHSTTDKTCQGLEPQVDG